MTDQPTIEDIEGHSVKVINNGNLHIWNDEDIPFDRVDDDLESLEVGDWVVYAHRGQDYLIVNRVMETRTVMEHRGGFPRVDMVWDDLTVADTDNHPMWVVPDDAITFDE